MVRVRYQPCSTPFPIYFSTAAALIFALVDFDLHLGSSQLGQTSWLPNLLVTGSIGDLLGLCPLFCLCTHGD